MGKETNIRGSLTIEAVLVLSVVLLTTVSLLFSFMLLYNRAQLLRTAADAADIAASMWQTGEFASLLPGEREVFREVLEEGELAAKGSQLLADLAATGDEEGMEMKKTRLHIYRQLEKTAEIAERSTIVIALRDDFLTRSIQVTLSQEIRVPFGRLKAFFTGKETINLTGSAASSVVAPAEFIRNVDLALEYLARLRQGEKWKSDIFELEALPLDDSI